MSANLSAIRKRAWETRRAKYGPRGHGSAYRTSPLRQSEAIFKVELARLNISQARRQCQIMLPDGAAHIAITRLDIADELLNAAFLPTFSERPAPRDSGRLPQGEDATQSAAECEASQSGLSDSEGIAR